MAIKLSNHPLLRRFTTLLLQTTINHHIWKRDFSGSSGLFAFSLKKLHSQNKIKKMFSNKLKYLNWDIVGVDMTA